MRLREFGVAAVWLGLAGRALCASTGPIVDDRVTDETGEGAQ